MSKITVIGLGSMGFPLAKRLLDSGFTVSVAIHKNPEPAFKLGRRGALVYDSVAGAVAGSDYILSILPGDKDIYEVFLSPAVYDMVPENSILVEMSTASPGCVRKLMEHYKNKNVEVFDAPVSGGVKGASEGKLKVLGGGRGSTLERIRFILDVFSEKVFHVGDVGAGKAIKAVNQLIVGSNAVVVAEALRLARHLEIPVEQVYEVVSHCSGTSEIFLSKFKKMAEEDFSPAFKLSLMKKDMAIALDEGDAIPLPLANLAHQHYLMLEEEFEDKDFSVVSTLFKRGQGWNGAVVDLD